MTDRNPAAMAIALRHSPYPQNEPWYLREMATLSRKATGHTKEGQIHANRLDSIAKMIEALLESEAHARDSANG